MLYPIYWVWWTKILIANSLVYIVQTIPNHKSHKNNKINSLKQKSTTSKKIQNKAMKTYLTLFSRIFFYSKNVIKSLYWTMIYIFDVHNMFSMNEGSYQLSE